MQNKFRTNWLIGIIAGLTALAIVGLVVTGPARPSKRHFVQPVVPTSNAGKILLLSDGQIQQLDVQANGPVASTLRPAVPRQTALSAQCARYEQTVSPNNHKVAIRVYCTDQTYTEVLDVATGEVHNVQPATDYPESHFLGWTPDGGSAVLWTGTMGEAAQIVTVDLENGQATPLNTPAYTYDAAISPANDRILYVVTKGLDWGGELWMMDRDGSNTKKLLQEPEHIIAFPRWSPDGKWIAYIRMIDTNIPFTVGELCFADGDGQNRHCLAQDSAPADAGRGYSPVWSPDAKQVAFVGRENPDDTQANEYNDALISNIFLADPQTGTARHLTNYQNVMTDGIVWSPNGQQLAFRKTENGLSDIWVIDIASGELLQVTHSGDAAWPAWLSQENAPSPIPTP